MHTTGRTVTCAVGVDDGQQVLSKLKCMTLPPDGSYFIALGSEAQPSWKSRGFYIWPEVTDLVRFFIVNMITAHLHSKVVQENHEAAPGSIRKAGKSVGNE